jgi:hypothetical protein
MISAPAGPERPESTIACDDQRNRGHAQEQRHEDPAKHFAVDDLHGLDAAMAAGERERAHDEVGEGEEDAAHKGIGEDCELDEKEENGRHGLTPV